MSTIALDTLLRRWHLIGEENKVKTNEVTITFLAPKWGEELQQTIPVMWCGYNILDRTLELIKEYGCTLVRIETKDDH